MGKCYIRPLVQRSLNNPPRLKWHNIFLGNERAGDVLASFELLNVKEFSISSFNHFDLTDLILPTKLPPDYVRSVNKYEPVAIPISIVPKLSQFTIEVRPITRKSRCFN